jgi:hypothetical protein
MNRKFKAKGLATPFCFSLLVSCLLSSCSTTSERNPAGENELTLNEVLAEVHGANAIISKDQSQCSSEYSKIYQQLFSLAGESTYLDLTQVASIDQDIQASFSARLALKDGFRNFKLESKQDEDCLKNASDVLRGLRYVEDYLIEIRMERAGDAPEEFVSLKGDFPYLLVNPKFAKDFQSYKDLRSGDVVLSRGNAYSSAAIARIGRNDYQFSHLSFVYVDPETKEQFTTEAHIEIGSVVNPLAHHIGDKNAREVVFRYQDGEFAHKASKLIYDRVSARQQSGKNIEYDFGMNYKEEQKLFCSEIVSTGFKMAGDSSVPMFKSKFTPGIIPFLNDIGVPATKENIEEIDTFSPGDIQFDPRFDLVAEWRNPKKMEESRIKDFILTKIFEKMDKENYQFDSSLKMDLESKGLWLLRRTPLVKKFIAAKFPLNMSPTQMQLFMTLDKVGEAVYKEIEVAALEYNRPMTPKEIYDTVDAFWSKDAAQFVRFKKGQESVKPNFHQYFHP